MEERMEKITLGPMPYMSVMPTVLVGANVQGRPNYMVAAWATVACMAPPMVCVAINKGRYTWKGIEENRTFSLNVPSVYGTLGTAPMAAECPVNIECELFESVDCGSHLLVIGKVAEIHAAKSCVTDGVPDIRKIDPIIYAQHAYYRVGDDAGEAFSAGKKYRKG
jgi:flavin reductase (DIM6/NTAB) family NADH-FMN oxidoreductase RutF